jgi:NitT/TauT family transport system ATP-binding protein
MSPRPGRIVDDLTVDIARPRSLETLTTEPFTAVKRQILGRLHSPV